MKAYTPLEPLEPAELAEFRKDAKVKRSIVKQYNYSSENYKFVYIALNDDVDNPAPDLEPDSDGEWHFVAKDSPRRVGCTVGWGWYRRI